MRLANVSHPDEAKDMGLVMGDRAYNSGLEFNVARGSDMTGTFQRNTNHPFTFDHSTNEARGRRIISTKGYKVYILLIRP